MSANKQNKEHQKSTSRTDRQYKGQQMIFVCLMRDKETAGHFSVLTSQFWKATQLVPTEAVTYCSKNKQKHCYIQPESNQSDET